MSIPKCSPDITHFVNQMGMSTTTPIGTYLVQPSNIALGILRLTDRFQSLMSDEPEHASLRTRWGAGRYVSQRKPFSRERTTTFTFDEIEGRPDDRVTFRNGHVGLELRLSRDARVLDISNESHGVLPISPNNELPGMVFTYEVGTSAHLSQFAVMNLYPGREDPSLALGIYHLLFTSGFVQQMADAAESDEELRHLAEACEQGNDVHFDAAFIHLMEIGQQGYKQPVHPLIKSLIKGASRFIPNLMAVFR